ncbi:MAG: hypothetical protein WCJ09_14330 [Planctomycetota bacterium]
MGWNHLSVRLALAAAMLSIPTLVDILFAITFIHDILNFIFMGALLLSFAMAISSVGISLMSTQDKRSVIVTIAIAVVPWCRFSLLEWEPFQLRESFGRLLD